MCNSIFCLQPASTCLCRHPVQGTQMCMQSKHPCSKTTTSLKTARSPAIPRHKNLITTPRTSCPFMAAYLCTCSSLFSEMPSLPRELLMQGAVLLKCFFYRSQRFMTPSVHNDYKIYYILNTVSICQSLVQC